jgi:hypothetical protein
VGVCGVDVSGGRLLDGVGRFVDDVWLCPTLGCWGGNYPTNKMDGWGAGRGVLLLLLLLLLLLTSTFFCVCCAQDLPGGDVDDVGGAVGGGDGVLTRHDEGGHGHRQLDVVVWGKSVEPGRQAGRQAGMSLVGQRARALGVDLVGRSVDRASHRIEIVVVTATHNTSCHAMPCHASTKSNRHDRLWQHPPFPPPTHKTTTKTKRERERGRLDLTKRQEEAGLPPSLLSLLPPSLPPFCPSFPSFLCLLADLGAIRAELGHAEELDGGVQQVRVLEVHAGLCVRVCLCVFYLKCVCAFVSARSIS